MKKFFIRTRLKKLVWSALEPQCWGAILRNSYPSFEHTKLRNYLCGQSIDMIFDVGANVGQFAVFSTIYFKGIPIHSFEPLEACFDKLSQVSDLYSNINPHNLALGSENKKMRLKFGSQLDSSSILSFSTALESNYGVSDSGASALVDTQRGDTFIRHKGLDVQFNRGLLKIDVQGYELHVLKGMGKFISSFAFIYVELSFVELYTGQASASEVIAFLFENNFELISIFNTDLQSDGSALQADFLFKNLSV